MVSAILGLQKCSMATATREAYLAREQRRFFRLGGGALEEPKVEEEEGHRRLVVGGLRPC